MTEKRLIEIKRNVMDELILLAMKQAVNETVQECADQTIGSEQLLVRRRILKLKVK